MGAPMLPEWRPQRTLIDLYVEKDGMKWYYRMGATVSSMMIVVGFFLFLSAFTQSFDSAATTSSALVGATILIIVAYAASAILSVITKSWFFQLELLYLPHLTSSVLGLISVIYAVAVRADALSNSSTAAHFAVVALVLSVASILTYATLSLLTFRKIYIVRARDAMHRPTTDQPKVYSPEVDQQRKQLLRLLEKQEKDRLTSTDNVTENTFNIDWPGGRNHSRPSSMSTFRYISRFASSTRYGSRDSLMLGPPADHLTGGIERVPSTIQEEPEWHSAGIAYTRRNSIFDPPTDHLTGGIERVPTLVQEESPVSSMSRSLDTAPMSTISQHGHTAGSEPVPLMPVAYVASSQAARYMGLESPIEPATPLSALPSYRADAHPSLNISTRPLARHARDSYPSDKKEPAAYAMPTSQESRPLQEGPYRMAAPSANTARNVARDTRRIQLELADRGPDGTRLRPELDSEALALSESIRRV